MLVGTFAEEIVRVLKFIILLVVKIDSAYQFDKFKFFNSNKQNYLHQASSLHSHIDLKLKNNKTLLELTALYVDVFSVYSRGNSTTSKHEIAQIFYYERCTALHL